MSEPPKIDSPEGMQALVDWARAHSYVLDEAHERMAKKHGVSLDGVQISRPLPSR